VTPPTRADHRDAEVLVKTRQREQVGIDQCGDAVGAAQHSREEHALAQHLAFVDDQLLDRRAVAVRVRAYDHEHRVDGRARRSCAIAGTSSSSPFSK
jgi:hypothetical protein